MNITGKSEKNHIAIIGRDGVGKSSFIKALAGYDQKVVIPEECAKGEIIKFSVEVRPLGPIVLLEAPGIDLPGEFEEGSLNPVLRAISMADFVIVVLDGTSRLSTEEKKVFNYLRDVSIPYVVAVNRIEFGVNSLLLAEIRILKAIHFEISYKENVGIDNLKSRVARLLPRLDDKNLIRDLVGPGEIIVLVTPKNSVKIRRQLVLPQVQTIKEALDESTIVIVSKEDELKSILFNLKNPPALVVTDSISIKRVVSILPAYTSVTTYSLLMSRYKGDLITFNHGLKQIDKLKDNDKVLISEVCSYGEYEDGLEAHKIARWLKFYTKKNLSVTFSKENDFPNDLKNFKLIIHCGGCSLSRHFLQTRINEAKLLKVPITNYGVLIAFIRNLSNRVMQPFGELNNSRKNFALPITTYPL